MPLDRGVPVLDGVFRFQNVPTARAHHQTEKPIGLMEKVVEIVPPGGTVLDCFMGSGSTGVACVRTGRRFIGIELNECYFETAARRIEEEASQETLFCGGGGTLITILIFSAATPKGRVK